MKKHAIIGFGCAGYRAAEAIRYMDPECEIDVFSTHSEAPYNPMMATYRASGRASRAALFPFGSLDEIVDRLSINVHLSCPVERVDALTREVVLAAGERIAFDNLLISSGARPVVPQIPDIEGPGVYLMRTQSDSDALFELLQEHRPGRAVVVGASMVGIKVAEVLLEEGVETSIIDMAPSLFPLAAYPDVAEIIGERVRAKGVSLILGRGLSGIEREGGKVTACLAGDVRLPSDIVLLCIGVRANTGMVDPAQIQHGRAIKVDGHMRTSAAGIYAAGDCCEGMDIQSGVTRNIGLWANAAHQGRAAGLNMAGGDISLRGNIPHNITHFMGMDFIGMGDVSIPGDEITFGEQNGKGICIRARLNNGELTSVNIFGNYRISGPIRNYFVKLLEGDAGGLTALQRGILNNEGIPSNFIEGLEGRSFDTAG